jgi:hypothetical protein
MKRMRIWPESQSMHATVTRIIRMMKEASSQLLTRMRVSEALRDLSQFEHPAASA